MNFTDALRLFGITAQKFGALATVEELTKMYHKLALKAHPDRNKDDPSATATFQKINSAHKLLEAEFKSRRPSFRQNVPYYDADADDDSDDSVPPDSYCYEWEFDYPPKKEQMDANQFQIWQEQVRQMKELHIQQEIRAQEEERIAKAELDRREAIALAQIQKLKEEQVLRLQKEQEAEAIWKRAQRKQMETTFAEHQQLPDCKFGYLCRYPPGVCKFNHAS
jgi:hypothetical protein